MLAIPSLAGVPPAIQAMAVNATAARMALEILPRRQPFSAPRRGKAYGFESGVLRELVRDRLQDALDDLAGRRIFDICIQIHTTVDLEQWDLPSKFASDRCAIVLISNRSGNYLDSGWILEHRWKSIEARRPGLAASALHTLDQVNRHGLCLYTPADAHHYCQYTQWHGEEDERYALEEYAECGEIDLDASETDFEQKARDAGMWTTTALDKALPREVRFPKCLPAAELARQARGRGETAEIARAVVALRALIRRASKRREPHIHTGYSPALLAFGYGAAVRWNPLDPMLQFFDDYGQMHGDDGTVEPVHGFYLCEPGTLDGILQAIHARVAVAAQASDLLHMIAKRVTR